MELEELLHNHQQLLMLLEEECLVAANCFGGEILEEYRKLFFILELNSSLIFL